MGGHRSSDVPASPDIYTMLVKSITELVVGPTCVCCMTGVNVQEPPYARRPVGLLCTDVLPVQSSARWAEAGEQRSRQSACLSSGILVGCSVGTLRRCMPFKVESASIDCAHGALEATEVRVYAGSDVDDVHTAIH